MCACTAWVPIRAARATDLARATPRPTGGDGDGPLADGRTPIECRAHCASSTGGGLEATVYASQIDAESSPRDRKGWSGVGCEERRLGAAPRRRAVARAHLTAGARTGLKRYVVGAVVRGFLVLVAQVLATTPSLEEAMVGGFDRWL